MRGPRYSSQAPFKNEEVHEYAGLLYSSISSMRSLWFWVFCKKDFKGDLTGDFDTFLLLLFDSGDFVGLNLSWGCLESTDLLLALTLALMAPVKLDQN